MIQRRACAVGIATKIGLPQRWWVSYNSDVKNSKSRLGISMLRKIVLATTAVVVCLGLLAFGGYKYYRQLEFKEKLNSAMARDAAYAETILKIESDSSNITYAELFSLCDKSIEGRQALIIELRGIQPGLNDELKQQLIGFLNTENDLVRSKRQMYEKSLVVTQLRKQAVDHIAEGSNGLYEYWLRRAKALQREGGEAAFELLAAGGGFTKAYDKALAAEKQIVTSAAALGIKVMPVFASFEKANRAEVSRHTDVAVSAMKYFRS